MISNWWHAHGNKMVPTFQQGPNLVIKGSVASLNIRGAGDPDTCSRWSLEWNITHADLSQVHGEVYFDRNELPSAFGLQKDRGDEFVLGLFDADSAKQGKYIRRGNLLNIPGPGTAYDGDPNISIFLDDEIKKAVTGLLDQ